MKNAIMANGLRRSLAQIRYVSPVLPDAADGLVASVYAQAEQDFGMVAPPLALHSPNPPVLAAAWAMLRETLLVTGQADRAEKEVVAAEVSVANTCPYCVAVHTAAAQELVPGLDAAGIASGDLASPLLKEIAGWARSSGLRGSLQSPPPGNFAELAGVAVTFQYLNRMVTIFLPRVAAAAHDAEGDWRLGHGHARFGHDLGQSGPRCLTGPSARCAAARRVLLGGQRFPHRGDTGWRGRGRRGCVGTGRHDARPRASRRPTADLGWAAAGSEPGLGR